MLQALFEEANSCLGHRILLTLAGLSEKAQKFKSAEALKCLKQMSCYKDVKRKMYSNDDDDNKNNNNNKEKGMLHSAMGSKLQITTPMSIL